MNYVFIVYKTDNHHSYSSRDVIGIGTSKDEAIQICKQQANKENQVINGTQIWNIHNIQQTQGYDGDGEFDYEIIETNKIL